jgi:hypothetical protein
MARAGLGRLARQRVTRLQLNGYLRGLLGRGYSVADEEGTLDGQLRLIIVRRGKEDVLAVETGDAWLKGLPSQPSSEDRMLLKHLSICVKRFFAHPEALPERSFHWPGTPQSRTMIRLALDPRRHRRSNSTPRESA